MTAADLGSEFRRASDNITIPHLMRLEKLGVHPHTAWTQPIGRDQVLFEDPLYQLTRAGLFSVIQPILGERTGLCHKGPPEILDLCAWRTSDARRVFLRLGIADVLGLATLNHARSWGLPIKVHQTPLSWLRGGGRGVCFLGWLTEITPEQARYQLAGIPRVIFDKSDFGFAEKVNRALRAPEPTPQIMIEAA